jgi:mannose-6-phosphate isomerase-like protein (cupin superfamily)
MSSLKNKLMNLNVRTDVSKVDFVRHLKSIIDDSKYTTIELNNDKPWGAYFRFDDTQADEFIEDFFPGLSASEARLNIPDAALSPKFLITAPGQRLSWQYHNRRAERWAFLTDGLYFKSETDEPGNSVIARPGDVVQFLRSERHRLVGTSDGYTIVAEIWQHVDPSTSSDEDDIIRLADDYSR